ncbi:hypothetical protein CP082626L3_1289 [Chlamydia psittaci 08-2626_L3]|nr:hypothetical protein CP082626L3_1289 [Chlamydia psittaci 08-2626_L3]
MRFLFEKPTFNENHAFSQIPHLSKNHTFSLRKKHIYAKSRFLFENPPFNV